MTTFNQTTLKTFFETGDVPSGNDYGNLIDSCVNVVNTNRQTMGGPLQSTELIAARVSAGNGNFTGNLAIAGTFSLANLSTGIVSAASLNATGDIAAATGSVNSSASRVSTGYYQNVSIVSAAGTTQATGAGLGTNGIIRLKGIVDGQTTGFLLAANLTGFEQTVWIEENTSCNLWPCVGGQINALSSNAAFAMTGNTKYVVTHIKASGYAVK